MAEAFALATGVTQLLSLAVDLAEFSSKYISSSRNATGMTRSYLRELAELQGVLKHINQEVVEAQSTNDPQSGSFLQGIDPKAIDECSQLLVATKAKLQKKQKSAALNKLTWPFREAETLRVVETLQRYRALFGAAIAGETFQLSKAVLTRVKRAASVGAEALDEVKTANKRLKGIEDSGTELKASVNSIEGAVAAVTQLGEESLISTLNSSALQAMDYRLRVLRWLSVVDVSVIHNTARKHHQAGTGQWLLESTVFQSWAQSDNDLLWLYGGPGCGKTVLASTLIDHLQTTNQSASFVAFYYFAFNDVRTQSVDAFLRSIIRQVASPFSTMPVPLRELFQQYEFAGYQPQTRNLLAVLFAMMAYHTRLAIIVDAVDECSEIPEFIDVILELSERYTSGLNIIMTSRKEKVINDRLQHSNKCHLRSYSIESALMNADILRYIQRQLKIDPVLAKRPIQDKANVEAALMKKANGMFRWVSCQFISLRRCRTALSLQTALDALPEGLEETYNRLLVQIPPSERSAAFAALEWLVFSKQELSINELAEAAVLPSKIGFDTDMCLFESHEILEICAGLVVTGASFKAWHSPDAVARLAHFSVQEFLVSGRIPELGTTTGEADQNHKWFDTAAAHKRLALTCINYLETALPASVEICAEHLVEFPMLNYAGRYWHHHASASLSSNPGDRELVSAIARLLILRRPAYLRWLRICLPDVRFGGSSFNPHRNLSTYGVEKPFHYACRFGFLENVEIFLRENLKSNPIHDGTMAALEAGWKTALRYGHIEVAAAVCQVAMPTRKRSLLPSGWVATIEKFLTETTTLSAQEQATKVLLAAAASDEDIVAATVFKDFQKPEDRILRSIPDVLRKCTKAKSLSPAQLSRVYSTAASCLASRGLDLLAKHPFNGTSLLQQAVSIGDLEMIKRLSPPAHTLNDVSTYGEVLRGTLLHRALLGRHDQVISSLLQQGASPDIEAIIYGNWHISTFSLAVLCEIDPKILPVLTDDAERKINDDIGTDDIATLAGTVIHHAIAGNLGSDYISGLLTRYDIDLNKTCHLGQDVHGSALHLAIMEDSTELAEALLRDDRLSIDFNSALRHESGTGVFHQVSLLELSAMQGAVGVARALLERGCAVASTSSASALQIAVTAGNLELARILLEAGADVEEDGRYGTASYIAAHEGRREMAELVTAYQRSERICATVPAYITEEEEEIFCQLMGRSREESDDESSVEAEEVNPFSRVRPSLSNSPSDLFRPSVSIDAISEEPDQRSIDSGPGKFGSIDAPTPSLVPKQQDSTGHDSLEHDAPVEIPQAAGKKRKRSE